ncbi:MAG: helix-turn-helix transcriptional regulator [Chloroflexi bacterium]|nr:helix-turn-helix transcriptional regulator [Chloroflexota bacterium]
MSNVQSLHTRWLRDPAYREAYVDLAPGFRLARALIEARTNAGLTQAQMAERMQTTQSVVARLESGRAHPSTRTLEKFARAAGTHLKISFEPNEEMALSRRAWNTEV